MAIIGLDKAMRGQQRAADRARERREGIREGRTAGTYDDVDEAEASCDVCGETVARGDLFMTERGSACPSCYGEAETAMVVASRLPVQLAALASPLPAVGVVGVMAWVVSLGDPSLFTGKGGMGWLLLAAMGGIAAVLAGLRGLKGLRSDLNPIALTDDEEVAVSWPAVAADGWAVLLATLAALAAPILAVLPFL